MSIRRNCDICNADIDVPGSPGDYHGVPHLSISHHGGINSLDGCTGCLKSIVRTLCERYPNAPRSFSVWARNALQELLQTEQREERWRDENPNTEEG